jgi:nucleoside-diphosphate-sugar epimerase
MTGGMGGVPETVLVTGAHGAIGCWATRELVRRGAAAVRWDLAPEPVTPFPELAGQPLVIGDIRDADLVARTLRAHGVTRFLHLAALIGERAERDPALAIEVNSLATARILDAAAAAGVRRVVAMSTKGVLGPLDARHLHPVYEPVPVDTPPRPQTVYEATKHLVEVAVAVARAKGQDAAAVRLATTWGPGKSGATHAGFSLHADMVAAAVRGESSATEVHPDQGHDLVYYGDVAAGLADLLLAPAAPTRPVYHLGSGRITRVGEFVRAVEAAFPGIRVATGERFPGGRSCLLDIGPLREDAGYTPRWDPDGALADVRALASAGLA